MEKNSLINKICGEKIGDIGLENIGNDPNFVFVNDPNFETLVLYGPENSVINVNSWLECANYVTGGWSNNVFQNTNYEKYYFYTLLFFSVVLLLNRFLKPSYVKK